jgi:hypothetical protein
LDLALQAASRALAVVDLDRVADALAVGLERCTPRRTTASTSSSSPSRVVPIACRENCSPPPRINPQQGRDHFPNAWSTVLAGGGISGGQAYGRTSADGTTVETEPTEVKHFLATVCRALGIDHTRQNMSNVGRPIRLVELGGTPIAAIAG